MATNAAEQMLVGPHVSVAGGLENGFKQALAVGASAVQIFTRSQRTWNTRPVEPEEAERFQQAWRESRVREVMSHDSYLINLGSPDPEKWEKSRLAFSEEVARCQALSIRMLNFHPGAATDGDVEGCLERIAQAVLRTMEEHPHAGVVYTLENTAGQGSAVGHRLEELAWLLRRINEPSRTGVCLDTCHLYAAGYDIATPEGYQSFWDNFQRQIGLENLRAFHINDSKKPLGSRVDRHELLGQGTLGLAPFQRLAQDPRFFATPFFLETPGDDEVWRREVALLRRFRQENEPV